MSQKTKQGYRPPLRVKEYLRHPDISYYGKSQEHPDEKLDCSLGTNPFGPPQKVVDEIESLQNDDIEICVYPDGTYTSLREKLSSVWSPFVYGDLTDRIRVGDGAKRVLENINKMVVQGGTTVLGYSPQYANYVSMVRAQGGRYIPVECNKEDGFQFPLQNLLNKIEEEQPALVYLDTPNNPTGEAIPQHEIEAVVRKASEVGTIVLVDEAYGGYLTRDKSAVPLVPKFENLVVVRSFSKAHGIAGFRIGYGVMSYDLLEYYDKVDPPFRVSELASRLAEVALDAEDDFLPECRKLIAEEKSKIIENIDHEVAETHPNVPIFFMKGETGFADTLKKNDILAVDGANFVDDSRYVRIRVPTDADEFLSRLPEMRG